MLGDERQGERATQASPIGPPIPNPDGTTEATPIRPTYAESEMAYRSRFSTGNPLDCESAVVLNGRDYPCLLVVDHPPPHECSVPLTQRLDQWRTT
jgi:hypothetical protein